MSDIQKIRVCPKVIFQDLGDESVLLNIETERYFGIDAVGKSFWETAAETEDFNAVLSQLLAEYDVDEQRLREDVTELAEKMCANGLLEIVT